MKAVLGIALGIIAAIGGFLDIGDLVFNTQAGALFGYSLLWVVPIGVLGIMVYAEMCGRVAIATGRPVFDTIRERLGYGPGLVALIASQFVNLLTVAAELGGIAVILNLLFDVSFSFFLIVAAASMLAIIWWLRFGGLERVFGYGGLMLLVFVAAALHFQPTWSDVADGFVPQAPSSTLYWYFVVGVMAAALMPYEVYFYSSGAVEEGWKDSDMRTNRLNVVLGYSLGGILAVALIVVSAQTLGPAGISPDDLGTVALMGQMSYGEIGLLLALGGMLFAIGGATIDASMSAGYNLAQYLGWEWGKYRGKVTASRFTLTWIVFILGGAVIAATGLNPVDITEYSVVLGVVALPLTYLPILLIAGDRRYMGDRVNGPLAKVLGWLYFVVILGLAFAAIPLLLATNGGAG